MKTHPDLEKKLSKMSRPLRKVERMNWTNLQAKTAAEKYTASRTTVFKTKEKGTMLPIRRICQKLGNDWEGALNWAYHCIESNEFELCVPRSLIIRE